MLKYLALTVGGQVINSPGGIPKPGIENKIISNSITIFITASIIICIIYIILAGIKFVTSGGDKQKVAAARASLTWAIIGIIVVLISFFIISIFSYAFGVNLLNFSLT